MCTRRLLDRVGGKTKRITSNHKNNNIWIFWGILLFCMAFFFNVLPLQLINNKSNNNHDHDHAGIFSEASAASATKAITISRTTTTNTTNEFGLLVVHCKEPNMTFLNQVPNSWFLRVYETCGQRSSGDVRRENDSAVFVSFNNYRQSEECSAYLDFIVQNYDQLPSIVIFMQSDSLQGYGKPKRNFAGHSPFRTIAEMEQVTREVMLPTITKTEPNKNNHLTTTTTRPKFLNFGPKLPGYHRFGESITGRKSMEMLHEPFMDLWTHHFAGFTSLPDSTRYRVESRPGATFAVHRDRIWANDVQVYKNLRDTILAKGKQHRHIADGPQPYCWSLENTWHVLLGEPWILPQPSTLDHIWPRLIPSLPP